MAVAVGPVAKSVVAESMAVVSTVVVRVSLSLSLPLAVVKSMTVAVGPVAKSMVSKSVVSVVGLSLSLSLPLAVVDTVAQTVVASETVAVVAKTVASVEEVGVSLCLGFRLSGSDGRESENYEQFHVECRMSRSKLCSPCTQHE